MARADGHGTPAIDDAGLLAAHETIKVRLGATGRGTLPSKDHGR
jgi:hypothetical protein